MGNMKGLTRGSSPTRGGSSTTDDPFAELEQMLNADLRRDGAGSARREPEFDAIDRDFQAAFETETARVVGARRASSAPSSVRAEAVMQPHAAQKAVSRQSSRLGAGSASRSTHPTDEEIDDELEEVLRNLSAPARPRDRIVVETQSFAPERAAEERVFHAPVADVDEFEELIRSELAVIRPSAVPQRTARVEQSRPQEDYEASMPFDAETMNYAEGPMEYGRPASSKRRWKRRMMATGSIAAMLFVGAGGVFLLHGASSGLGGDDGPLLIKADAEPYKIAPKDPGGRAYPNQNKAVYDRVTASNKKDEAPVQQTLLQKAEEPMELPTDGEEDEAYSDALPGVELAADQTDAPKDETRVTSATEADEGKAEHVLQPRRVKTMRVGPDGRLMPSDPAPAVAAAVAPAAAAPVSDIAALAAQTDLSEPDPVQVAAVPVRPAVAPSPRPASAAPVIEASAPATQATAAMPTGGYFVQVASQPTEASAQQSLANMGSRYAAVIAGRPMGILAADIPGKGTYYRVRVAAGSKDEAAGLCSRLKAAGGTCLVTR